jgi:hypothetical protein
MPSKQVKTVRTSGGKSKSASGENMSPISKLIAKQTKKELMSEECRGVLIKIIKDFLENLKREILLYKEMSGNNKVVITKKAITVAVGLGMKKPHLLNKVKVNEPRR